MSGESEGIDRDKAERERERELVGGEKGKTEEGREGKVDKRVRKKARISLWVKTVADEELTRKKKKEGRTRKQSSYRG